MIDRFKLHGTYRTPRFRLGDKVDCQVRGELTIVGITDARIPWPLGNNRRGARSLIVYGDLVRAIKRESMSAVCHWFGVHSTTVTKWRKALGVPERNYGTRKLWEEVASAGGYWNGVEAGIAKARDPIRRAKIAAANRGKRRPRAVVQKIRRAHLGEKRGPEARRKMNEAWKRRGNPKRSVFSGGHGKTISFGRSPLPKSCVGRDERRPRFGRRLLANHSSRVAPA